jgi:hypothetical protein
VFVPWWARTHVQLHGARRASRPRLMRRPLGRTEAIMEPAEARLQDPLSEVTRVERRNLLAASAVGLVIAKAGLVPTKISALGIDFSSANQRALLFIIGAVVCYLVVAFSIYASSDLLAWRVSVHAAIRGARAAAQDAAFQWGGSKAKLEDGYAQHRKFWARASRPMSVVRAFFEVGVPILLGLYAAFVLFTTRPASGLASVVTSSRTVVACGLTSA